MICYRLVSQNEENAISVDENTYIVPHTCTPDEERSVTLTVANWNLRDHYYWRCDAENDGGIDARDEEITFQPLEIERIILNQGKVYGYYFRSNILTFENYKTDAIDSGSWGERYVPTWGSVSSSNTYSLCPKEGREEIVFSPKNNALFESGCIVQNGKLVFFQRNKSLDGNSVNDEPIDLVIPKETTSIANAVFKGNTFLRSVVIPEGVTEIEDEAFLGCTSLTSVSFPSSLTAIGISAFEGCEALQSISLPDGITVLRRTTFKNCKHLQSVSFPATLELIEREAFIDCESLCDIVFPDALTTIREYAFKNCKALPAVTVPNTIKELGFNAFEGCASLCTVVLPESIRVLPSGLFYKCTSLCEIHIPSNVTTVGSFAFGCCESLKEIDLPQTVTDIGNNTFTGCTALTSITLPAGIDCLQEQCFSGCSSLQTVHLSEGLKKIKEKAFAECTSLREITFPESLESIGYEAFLGCTSLVSISLPCCLTYLGIDCFANSAITKVVVPGNDTLSIAWFHFRFMPNLREIVFAEGLTRIEPEGAIRIYENMRDSIIRHAIFDEMQALETVTLPASLQSFIPTLFEKCESLKTVRIRKGFQKAEPSMFPAGITVEYGGSEEEWAEICADPENILLQKGVTVRCNVIID